MTTTDNYRHLFSCSRILVAGDHSPSSSECKVLYGAQKLTPQDVLQAYTCRTCQAPLSSVDATTANTEWPLFSIRRAKRMILSPYTPSKPVECRVRVYVNGLRAPARLTTTERQLRDDIARINHLASGDRGTTAMPAADAIREISNGGMRVCGVLHSVPRDNEPEASLLRSLEPILLYLSCRGDMAVAMDTGASTFLVPFADEVLIIARWNKKQ